MLTSLGSVFISLTVLGTLVLLLFAAIIVFMVRDARHQERGIMLGQMLYQAQQDRNIWLEIFNTRRYAEAYWEPREAAEAAEAAQRGEEVPVVVPLSVRHCMVPENQRHLKSFGPPISIPEEPTRSATQVSEGNYPEELNPFRDGISSTSASPLLFQDQPNILEDVTIDVCPETFSVAKAGIRSKLEEIFEPREQVDDGPVQMIVQADIHADDHPADIHADDVHRADNADQVHRADVLHTATIQRRPSQKKRRAPPPPTLPKPKVEILAARGAISAGTATIGRTSSSRRAPSPPRRSSSLRSLHTLGRNSLRRSKNTALYAESQLDLPSEFLEKNDLYMEDQQFVTYV
jgi:hypothetical protein